MSDVATAPATPAAAERGFTQLVYQLDDYPGPRLPIVMGVFYIFIGPIVAISKDVSLAAAMTALMIGGLVQFAWSPLIGKMQRFFPAIVTGTTILLIGTGLMKIGINVATGLNTPAFGTPLTLGLAALMIALIIVISVYARGFIRTLSLFVTMVIGYLVSAALGLLNFQSVTDASWVSVPNPLPYGALEWPKVGAIIALMPNAVLGGVLLFMFGMVASVGLDIIGRNMTSRRDALIVASSLALGLGIQAAPPNAFVAIPQAIRVLVTDGIVMGILLAMVLNIVLPRDTGPKPAAAH